MALQHESGEEMIAEHEEKLLEVLRLCQRPADEPQLFQGYPLHLLPKNLHRYFKVALADGLIEIEQDDDWKVLWITIDGEKRLMEYPEQRILPDMPSEATAATTEKDAGEESHSHIEENNSSPIESDAAPDEIVLPPPPASEDTSGTESPQPHTPIVDTWNDVHVFPESHTVRRDGVKEFIQFQQKDGKDLTKTWQLFLRLYEAKGQSITVVDGPGVRQCIGRLKNKLHRLPIHLVPKKVDQHYIIAMLIGPPTSESKDIPE